MDGDYSEGIIKECLRSTIVVVPKKTKIVDLKEFVLQHLRSHPRMQGIQRKDVQLLALC